MLGEERLDTLTVLVEMALQGAKLSRQGQRQQALGLCGRLAPAEGPGLREQGQPLLVRLRAIELGDVQELLPSPFARLVQGLGRGERFDKGPTGWRGPVVEGLQGYGVVFTQSGPQLADQRRALSDEPDLVATQQA